MEGDGILAAKAARGDADAFTELVRRHERRVRAFLQRLARGDGADDLAQETFLKAWRLAATFRGEGSYQGWLLRIAWSLFVSRARKRTEQAMDPAELSEGACDGASERLDVERALARLPERERAAAILCYAEGYSHGEAAAILKMPLGTLKSVVARAKAELVRQLEGAKG
ncbi:MAG TPA: sigma-70 family RNA polymerase sigma factor [Allosphingosinicella sp.]|nr:sigma-70 family RNA polymerase sigma factor [Allosphingosinicella sp.]